VLTLSHGKANAFDAELCHDLLARVDECRERWCSAVVITGRGTIFSAGVDLLRVVEEGRPYVERFLPLLSESLAAVFCLPKPVVAAVNGHAIAGGCVLACAADRRLMARGSGRIGVPELLVGVPFPAVPLEIMRFAAPACLSALVFDGATFTADDAVRHGLIDGVVDAEALVADAVAAALVLAERPAAAFALTKRLLRGGAVERMDAGRRQLDRAVQDCWAAPETLDAIRGYIQRTFKKG
jgi:enoyl-CoA hydratase